MKDKELLELAAKAAGYEVLHEWLEFTVRKHEKDVYPWQWNPLTDDGDALRLAVKLELGIAIFCNFTEVTDGVHIDTSEIASEITGLDPVAATRRAIVRAAAEIGKAMV